MIALLILSCILFRVLYGLIVIQCDQCYFEEIMRVITYYPVRVYSQEIDSVGLHMNTINAHHQLRTIQNTNGWFSGHYIQPLLF